ncbi:Integral membrane protein-like protein [Verrucomicrobia bacterium]|nr:Integral membrane protein-like protein [Verrucomicrobiota bacterium]
MAAYAITIFAGAFLLFQVQPILGKFILPWFGGGPGVWTVCLLFFQVLLLGGYAYAYLISRWLKPRAQAGFHLALLLASLALLPITPAETWKPQGGGNPTAQILLVLAVCVGVPYFVLSSTGPLMQHWFSRTNPGKSPYRLFALSNAGSLLALVSFPFYVETHFTRQVQARVWGWGLVAYALCSAICALKMWRASERPIQPGPLQDLSQVEGLSKPRLPGVMLWLLLPACASALLLATTNKMCQDVAVVPFLWVLPLALYLLSFIVCFENPRWYRRSLFTLGLIAALGGICWALFRGVDLSIRWQVGIYCGALFLCCMVCHGELYRLRPDPRRLTAFYLMIAAGGALGGLFVAVAAPLVFTDYYELHYSLIVCAVLFVVVDALGDEKTHPPASPGDHVPSEFSPRTLALVLTLCGFVGVDRLVVIMARHYPSIPKGYFLGLRIGWWALLIQAVVFWVARKKFRTFLHWRWVSRGWLYLGVLALGTALWTQARQTRSDAVYSTRNFYGVLKLYEERKGDPKEHHFLLQHGRITHGLQFVEPEQARWPTTYFGEESGVGLALQALPPGPRRIGVVGLGAGTLSAYARPGDYVRIYEINPEVLRLAQSRFTYLRRCAGTVEVALGDARLSMEREPPQHFDLLALDAFSSDSIPVHLLTKEAFEGYQRHLNPGAVIAVHISNHYLDLEPVVSNIGRHFNYQASLIDFDEDEDLWWLYSSTWILLTHNEAILDTPAIRQAAGKLNDGAGKVPLWTDDFASVFQILK